MLFLLVGLCICIAAVAYLYDKWEERVQREKRREERVAARTRVSLTDVEIVERKLLGGSEPVYDASLGAERIFIGRVRNKSTQYELAAIQVELTVKDCVDDDCEIVGQDTTGIDLEIPPGQSRDFRETFHFRPTLGKPRGRFVWSHRVVQSCSGSGLPTDPCRDSLWYIDYPE